MLLRSLIALVVWTTAIPSQAQEPPQDLPPKEPPEVGPADQQLAAAGVGILKKFCYRCHGVERSYPGLDVLNRDLMLKPKVEDSEPFLVPGQPNQSRIYNAVDTDDYMPPEGQPQPTAEEIATLRRWIKAGAPFPRRTPVGRPFRGEETVLAIIAADLQRPNLTPQEQRRTRYFSLLHLWNDPQVSEAELRLTRAAVSKLINSLSQESQITPPRLVDRDGLVMAVDLADYGWNDREQWRLLEKAYPYGLRANTRFTAQVFRLTNHHLPYLRADWFVHRASRGDLYHDLMLMPSNAKRLERELGVDIAKNFQTNRLARAAFQASGVSRQNRLVERHAGKYGAYWKSYDFPPGGQRSDLTRFPLGPVFEDRPLAGAFEHAGGEVIYALPNGLHGYLLVDGEDVRIDAGPTEIVEDRQAFSGSGTIVNAVSCMGCHKQGMISFEDTVRQVFERQRGKPSAAKVLELYPPAKKMNKLVQRDRRDYLRALEEACEPFLKVAKQANAEVTFFPEPVTQVSVRYDRKVSLETAAAELGLEDPKQLRAVARLPSFRSTGLAPLAQGQRIDRATWEQNYHEIVREMGLGVPFLEK